MARLRKRFICISPSIAIDGTSDLSNSRHHACNSDVDTPQAQRDNIHLPEFEFLFASEVKKLVRILKDYPWSVLVAAYGTFEIILKVFGNATASTKAVRWLMDAGTRIDPQGTVVTATWLILLLTGVFVGFAIFLGAYILTQIRLNRSLKHSTGLKTLDGMFIATSKIRNSLWPQNLKPPHTFTTIRRRHLIHNDLTVSSYSEHHVKALSGPVHYFVWSVGSETEATPVDHLLEVDFRVKDITPGGNFETAYLQSENEPHGKEVLIYFLTLLQPSESTPRIIEITYVWPGYYLRLKEKEEIVSIDLTQMRAGVTVDLIELEFYLQPGTGKRLVCKRAGSLQGTQSQPVAISFKHPNGESWQGWKYTVTAAPPEEYAVRLELETS